MRKTININLGGMAFVMDDNAFEMLNKYLDSLKKKFNDSERSEIMQDIEARIAELIANNKAQREVVSLSDVEAAINVMGRPEDFGAEEETANASTSSSLGANNIKTGRKLFRNPDDKKIGGVISGICLYFGIEDATWMRLLAVALIFLTGFQIIWIYLILLIVMPEASTASEKLLMRGEAVTIDNIEREFRDTAKRMEDSLKGINVKQESETVLQRLASFLIALLKLAGKIIALVFVIVAFCLLLALIVSLFTASIFTLPSLSHLAFDSNTNLWVMIVGGLLAIGAPLIWLIYSAIKFIVGSTHRVRGLGAAFGIASLLGFILLAISGYNVTRHFSKVANRTDQLAILQPSDSTLYIEQIDSSESVLRVSGVDDEDEDGFGIKINGKDIDHVSKISIGEVKLNLVPVSGDSFTMERQISSRGLSKDDALSHMRYLVYSYSQADSILRLNEMFELDKKGKWRNQKIAIVIGVPVGRKVHLSNQFDEVRVVTNRNDYEDQEETGGATWLNDNGSLRKLGNTEEAIYLEGDTKNEEPW